jgi:hypothetical protein
MPAVGVIEPSGHANTVIAPTSTTAVAQWTSRRGSMRLGSASRAAAAVATARG